MNKLSEKQVKNLNKAIDETMDIIDSTGCSPNDAIVKVAKSMKLTPDYIPVIVAAYNNGAQYAQRENGTTILEKTAKFPIADLNSINSNLYSNTKKAGLHYVGHDDFFDYPVSVTNNDISLDPLFLNAPVVKAAEYKRESNTAVKREQRITDGVNTVVESIRMEKSAAADNYDDAIKDLAYYLRLNSSPSIGYAVKLASTVFDKPGSIVIKAAASRFNLKDTRKQEPVVSITSDFYKHCRNCVEKLAEYNKVCDQELGLLKSCANTLKPIVNRRINAIYKQSSLDDTSPKYFFEKKNKEYIEKESASILPQVGGYTELARGNKLPNSDISGLEALVHPQWRDLNPYEHNIMRSLSDPEQESKLRDIAVNSSITELINTDEYLSDKDPEEVIDAYNELMEIAPEIHNKKPLLRAALRQFMESGGIDVQSLGLIGDVGRKTESRTDAEKALLSQQVEKALEYSSSNKSETRKLLNDMERFNMQSELTVSEGRKQRMQQAELARKQMSEKRKDTKDRLRAERDRFLLQREDARLNRQADEDLERLKSSLRAGTSASEAAARVAENNARTRSKNIADFMSKWTGDAGKNFYTRAELNSMLSDAAKFNALTKDKKQQAFNSLAAMGFDDPATGKTLDFDSDFNLRPGVASMSVSNTDMEEAAKRWADTLDNI